QRQGVVVLPAKDGGAERAGAAGVGRQVGRDRVLARTAVGADAQAAVERAGGVDGDVVQAAAAAQVDGQTRGRVEGNAGGGQRQGGPPWPARGGDRGGGVVHGVAGGGAR